jgi:uncharacterized protein DUF1707
VTDISKYILGSVDIPGTDIHTSQRASHDDRDRCIAYLSACHARGQLSLEVYEARHEAVQKAVTQKELTDLVADLPPFEVPATWFSRFKAHLGLKPLSAKTRRRWWHLGGATGTLCLAILAPMMIYNLTGYQVIYTLNGSSWTQLEHNGLEILAIVFCGITGALGFIANLLWWISSEDVL